MKRHFTFKELFRKMPNVSIPKDIIYAGIGIVLVIMVGLIASNMYLQEMLFFEGQEKALPLFTEEELRYYGSIYKDLSLEFQNNIGAFCQNYANRTNRAGENIHYGIYNHEHTTNDTNKIKIHNNGQNVNRADDNHQSDYNDAMNTFECKDSYIESDEFKNGINVKYSKTEGKNDGESNYKDLLVAVSMILDQKQTRNNTNSDQQNIKDKVPDLIKKLFKMTHTFTGETKELYACNKGCRVLFYYCNEIDSRYQNTGIDLKPFEISPHDDFEDYSSDSDFEIVAPEDECEICGHNGKGCVLDSQQCYHGHEDEERGKHYLGIGKAIKYADQCSHCHDINDCIHECK